MEITPEEIFPTYQDTFKDPASTEKPKLGQDKEKALPHEMDGDSDSEDFDYKEELKDFPHIAKFISRLKRTIRKQKKKIKKLKNKLETHKATRDTCDAASQTDPVSQGVGDGTAWSGCANIADEVKQAAEETMLQSGMCFEPTSGMYYDYNSGYYYNAELRMYYDGYSGRYMAYDEETKQYSYVDNDSKTVKQKKRKRRRERVDWSEDSEEERKEVGELTSSEEEGKPGRVNGKRVSKDAKESKPEDAAQPWPPCLRLMVLESSAVGVAVGQLFLVTCKGGDVGREGSPAVLLPEQSVSKVHLKIHFDKCYKITDPGSRNGTLLNGKRVSASLQESEPMEIAHGDLIRIGSTTLAVHVHGGQDTCEGCEPGLQQRPESISSPLPVNVTMRSLKKRFGVIKGPNVSKDSYNDRAEKRRVEVGSSHPAEKTETACVNQSIPKANKGFKMLAKMGWSQGQSLGKDGSGITEPVPLVSNEGSTGLGATALPSVDRTLAAKRKLRMLKMTQERFNRQPTLPPGDDEN